MGIKFSNNAYGVLDSGITDSATTLDLTANGALFPEIVLASGDYFYATITNISGGREVIKCTHHTDSSDTFQVFERAQDDTDAIAFGAGDKVQIRFPKIILEEFRDDIAANLAAIESNDSDISDLEDRATAIELYQTLGAPTGLTMFIYNPAGEIPTGWSAKSGPADALLAIAGGSEDYDVAGETLAGSWTPTGHLHTIAHLHTITHTHDIQHTHEGGSISLSIAQMPVHTHTTSVYNYNGLAAAGNEGTFVGYNVNNFTSGVASGSSGSGNVHSHGTTISQSTNNTGASSAANTGAVDTANSGTSKEPSTDRPYAAVGLLIERD